MRILVGLLLAAISLTAVADDGLFHFNYEELAPGVWTGVREDSPRFPVMGNVTFVISDEGVVVYDGGGMPAMAEQTMAKIQSLTDAPVTHVIISHWHGDHNFGIYRYAEEYPDVDIVAHEFTNTVFNSTRITYVDRQRNFIEGNREEFAKIAETGVDSEGTEHSDADRREYEQILEDGETINHEFNRAKVTPANVTLTDRYTIQSGDRMIEVLYLGQANTAGDVVMWLPDEKIVATGDIVVLPSPYAFNVPPRKWAQTLSNINALDYEILVPGHGSIQRDTSYVDLIIETATSIADQRDALLADGKSSEETQEELDFSAFEERFTHGDEYVKGYYDAYFEVPFRAAAMKALTGEPMVALEAPISVAFDTELWELTGESEIVDYLGQSALQLKGGFAMLKDSEVHNGIVEFDIAVSEERGFAGLVFRAVDTDYEHFYIRPHQSGKPDANQYTPVFNGVSGWQLYHGDAYAVPLEYKFDEWMHVKVVFAGAEADVYVDSDKPVLHVDLMLDDVVGQIGVNSSGFSTAYFANFQYSPLAELYAFPSTGPSEGDIEREERLVASWEVSEPFDGSTLGTLVDMASFETKWSVLESEQTGITNLARVNGLGEAADTVFTCLRIKADQAGVKQLKLGYSDRATVYVNGKAIYEGDNTYMSRDYRYLGTIGLFDSVYLPLDEGENEVWIAVSEAFGGWGVIGQWEDMEGIEVMAPR
jgi:glyoxylase-like metal-dependent hydrolase (beta-lactamase superfamily II)